MIFLLSTVAINSFASTNFMKSPSNYIEAHPAFTQQNVTDWATSTG